MKNIKDFWLGFKEVLAQNHVNPKAQEYYIRWAKNFAKAFPDLSLQERTHEDVQSFIDAHVRKGHYEEWQLDQINDTLRLLYAFYLKTSWSQPWPVSVKSDKIETAVPARSRRASTPQFDDRLDPFLVEKEHAQLLAKVRTFMRTTHYAIRTERAYLDWICRFIMFNGLKHQ